MKIAIISDSHDNWQNLEKSVAYFNAEKCEVLLFAGDLVAPTNLDYLALFNGKVYTVWGNNDGEKYGMCKRAEGLKNIVLAGEILELQVSGCNIFISHYPRISELAAKSGEFQLAVCGHTHAYHQEIINKCLLLNPGSLQDYKTEAGSLAIYDTTTATVKRIMVRDIPEDRDIRINNKSARGFVLKGKKILVMHRIKNGTEYYVFPGGHMEVNETPEECARREVFEETAVKINTLKPAFNFSVADRSEYFFIGEWESGEPALNGEEARRNRADNLYEPMWVDIAALDKLPNLYSEEAKKWIFDYLKIPQN